MSSCPPLSRALIAIVATLSSGFFISHTSAQPRLTGSGAMPEMAMQPHGVDVVTRSYSIGRTGTNTTESVLNPTNVAGGLKKLFSLNVTDDPRLEAQPLIMTNLKMSDGKTHDVVFVCTMDNNVWAFDANNGTPIWPAPVSLGPSIHPKLTNNSGIPSQTEIDMWGINKHWGILSTPVIDPDTQTLYVVDWTSPDNSVQKSFYQLHALNLADGKDKANSPQTIQASVTVSGKVSNFLGNGQKQRSALLLLPLPNAHMRPAGSVALSGNMGETTAPAAKPESKVLVMACGMQNESTDDQHGWVIAFDPVTLKTMAAFCTTPTTGGGGIWQGAQGPAADTGGNVYVMTSNGGFNGVTDFAESFLMLNYQPPPTGSPAGAQGKWVLKTWFTPFRDADRLKAEPGTGYPFQDQDLGSAGPVVPAGRALVMGAGKDGVLYVLGKGNFGNSTDDQITDHTQFAQLKMEPIFFTYFHGFNVDATDTNVLDSNFEGKTHHLHHSPAYWDSPDSGPMLYCWGENGNLRAWSVSSNGIVTFLANGLEIASKGCPGLGGMPGAMLAVSANGKTKHTGIVWATAPITGDGNRNVVEGILRAYDASQFIPASPQNPNATIKLLWDSTMIPNNTFTYDKFCPPVVANGKVYVTTYDGRVDVYGL